MNKFLQGDALSVLRTLPDESVNCVITSPPYWGLRAYKTSPQIWDGDEKCEHEWGVFNRTGISGGTKSPKVQIGGLDNFQIVPDTEQAFCSKCSAWRGELGLEPTFELYIKHLCAIFDEVKRVLRKDGTCFVNLGDSYAGSNQGHGAKKLSEKQASNRGTRWMTGRELPRLPENVPAKSLCLIPERFAIEMVSRNWILRNKIVWWKRNCMPSSASDRFTVDFENVFFFVKSKRYWFEQQFENYAPASDVRYRQASRANRSYCGGPTEADAAKIKGDLSNSSAHYKRGEGSVASRGDDADGLVVGGNQQGRNMRAVWDIPTSAFSGAHFAVFPEALVRPMLLAGCPEFVCEKCGKARKKIYRMERPKDYDPSVVDSDYGEHCLKSSGAKGTNRPLSKIFEDSLGSKRVEVGLSDCGCGEPFRPGVVLDPFSGSGTVAVVAKKLGRDSIGIELNPEYVQMSEKRLAQVPERLL